MIGVTGSVVRPFGLRCTESPKIVLNFHKTEVQHISYLVYVHKKLFQAIQNLIASENENENSPTHSSPVLPFPLLNIYIAKYL